MRQKCKCPKPIGYNGLCATCGLYIEYWPVETGGGIQEEIEEITPEEQKEVLDKIRMVIMDPKEYEKQVKSYELGKEKINPEDYSNRAISYGQYIAGIDPVKVAEGGVSEVNIYKLHSPELIEEMMQKADEYSKGKFDYTAEDIERIRKEGINADQEDKTDWEEYVDTIAVNRIIADYEKSMIVGEDMICPVAKEHCDDECCPVGAVCNMSSTEGISPDENPTQTALNQSYEQYINPQPLEIDWEKSCIAIMKEKMEVEQKILQWYLETGDEKFREMFDIKVRYWP